MSNSRLFGQLSIHSICSSLAGFGQFVYQYAEKYIYGIYNWRSRAFIKSKNWIGDIISLFGIIYGSRNYLLGNDAYYQLFTEKAGKAYDTLFVRGVEMYEKGKMLGK